MVFLQWTFGEAEYTFAFCKITTQTLLLLNAPLVPFFLLLSLLHQGVTWSVLKQSSFFPPFVYLCFGVVCVQYVCMWYIMHACECTMHEPVLPQAEVRASFQCLPLLLSLLYFIFLRQSCSKTCKFVCFGGWLPVSSSQYWHYRMYSHDQLFTCMTEITDKMSLSTEILLQPSEFYLNIKTRYGRKSSWVSGWHKFLIVLTLKIENLSASAIHWWNQHRVDTFTHG